MGLVNPTQSSAGDTIEAADVNTPVNQLAAVINGNIDAQNIADSSITSAKIADGGVAPVDLVAGLGSSWTWQAWTPTWANLTIGNGTNTCTYTQIGKTVIARIHLLFGTTTSMGASRPTFTLPVAAAAFYGTNIIAAGEAILNDASAGVAYIAVIGINASTTVGTFARPSADPPQWFTIASTTPFTWATGDVLSGTITYEAA